jgi:hypothetical protein
MCGTVTVDMITLQETDEVNWATWALTMRLLTVAQKRERLDAQL